MLPTTPARATHDYERNGTCDLFAALEIATGKVITDIRARHTSADFVAFLNKVDRNVPDDLDVHVILDNLSAHKTPTVHKWLLRHKRFHFHFTPTYGSWMNLVERWFSALTTKKLQRSAHRSVNELAADIKAWAATWNDDPKPVRLAQDRRADPRTPRRLLHRHQPRHRMTHQLRGAPACQDTSGASRIWCWWVRAARPRRTLAMISSAGLCPDEGFGVVVPVLGPGLDALRRGRSTLVKVPRRSRRSVSRLNQPSTRFSHDDAGRREVQMPAGPFRVREPLLRPRGALCADRLSNTTCTSRSRRHVQVDELEERQHVVGPVAAAWCRR